jgi:hypothetical protein
MSVTPRRRSDDERAHAGQLAEHGDGPVERDRHHRRTGPVDARVGVHALADPQRGLRQVVQHAADRADLATERVRRAKLAEDLRLADHHRVQAGRDGHQVLDRRLGEVHVQVLGQVSDRHPRVAREHGGDLGDGRVEPGDVGVHLDAIAGREEQHLTDRLGAVQLVERLAQLVDRDHGLLQQGDRRGAV